MAAIKAYTDLEQSKKLAEILPTESADMYYCYGMDIHTKKWDYDIVPTIIDAPNQIDVSDIPAWSLTALLDILPLEIELHKQSDGNVEYYYMEYTTKKTYFASKRYTDPIDAAFEMVVWLKENEKL